MVGRERVSPAEVAALVARLRVLSAAGADVEEGERERFLQDKDRLLTRIEADTIGPAVEQRSRSGSAATAGGYCCEGTRQAELAANGWNEDTVDWDAVEEAYRAEADADRDDDGDIDGWAAS